MLIFEKINSPANIRNYIKKNRWIHRQSPVGRKDSSKYETIREELKPKLNFKKGSAKFEVMVGVPALLTLKWGGEKVKGGQNGSQRTPGVISWYWCNWEWKEEGGNSLLLIRNCLFFPCEKVFHSIFALKIWIPWKP